MMRLPLTHWTLQGDHLPERMLCRKAGGFFLPGAAGLSAFADLLGGEPANEESEGEQEEAPFALPGLLPSDVCGCVSLNREIDFGALRGDRALLELDHLAGRGSILLDGEEIARFGEGQAMESALADAADKSGRPCMLAVELTDALRLGRRRTLTLRFEAARPAGACGPVFLMTTVHAFLSRVTLTPDLRGGTVALRARLHARRAGRYVLRVQPVGMGKGAAPAREKPHVLSAGETREAMLRMEMTADRFVPGRAHTPPALKVQLFLRAADARGEGVLCDEALLLCGYPAGAECAFVPMTAQETRGDPATLAARLGEMHIPAVCPQALLPDAALRALCRAGVGVCMEVQAGLMPLFARYPNLQGVQARPAQAPGTALTAAWQLCSMTAFPRAVDDTMTPEELLLEASGRVLDPDAESVRAVLDWLSAVAVRLRAEAARQDRFAGALCRPGELENGDVCEALRTAFAPLHLSALPMYGAWWTGMRFSAALEVFLPPDMQREAGQEILASAVLEDESGGVLACLDAPCGQGGVLGVLEAVLPVQPCVLTLTCCLTCGGRLLERHELPVYVGERGPLEAAFG